MYFAGKDRLVAHILRTLFHFRVTIDRFMNQPVKKELNKAYTNHYRNQLIPNCTCFSMQKCYMPIFTFIQKISIYRLSCGVFRDGVWVFIFLAGKLRGIRRQIGPSLSPGLACRDRKKNAMNINTHQACVVTTATGAVKNGHGVGNVR